MQPTRRAVLLGAGVSALAACTPDRSPRPSAPSLEDALRAEAATREQALVAAYRTALLEQPTLNSTLAPVLADHSAHLAALAPASTTSTPSALAAPPPTQRSRSAVLAGLVALERTTATAHADAAERADTSATCDRTLAPLLASLAACEASHAAVL